MNQQRMKQLNRRQRQVVLGATGLLVTLINGGALAQGAVTQPDTTSVSAAVSNQRNGSDLTEGATQAGDVPPEKAPGNAKQPTASTPPELATKQPVALVTPPQKVPDEVETTLTSQMTEVSVPKQHQAGHQTAGSVVHPRAATADVTDTRNDYWMDHDLQKVVMYAINHSTERVAGIVGPKLPHIKSITEITPELVAQLRWISALAYENADFDKAAYANHQKVKNMDERTDDVLNIQSLRGLEGATNLRELDIQPVDAIGNEVLSTYGNGKLCDIQAIKDLTGITNLNLQSNSITDISALANLQNISTASGLAVASNYLTDFSPLATLTKKLQQHDPDALEKIAYGSQDYRSDIMYFNPKVVDLSVPIPTAILPDGTPMTFELEPDENNQRTGRVEGGEFRWSNLPDKSIWYNKNDAEFGTLVVDGLDAKGSPVVKFTYRYHTGEGAYTEGRAHIYMVNTAGQRIDPQYYEEYGPFETNILSSQVVQEDINYVTATGNYLLAPKAQQPDANQLYLPRVKTISIVFDTKVTARVRFQDQQGRQLAASQMITGYTGHQIGVRLPVITGYRVWRQPQHPVFSLDEAKNQLIVTYQKLAVPQKPAPKLPNKGGEVKPVVTRPTEQPQLPVVNATQSTETGHDQPGASQQPVGPHKVVTGKQGSHATVQPHGVTPIQGGNQALPTGTPHPARPQHRGYLQGGMAAKSDPTRVDRARPVPVTRAVRLPQTAEAKSVVPLMVGLTALAGVLGWWHRRK